MGEVFLKYRITPEGPEVDLEGVQGAIKEALPAFAQMQNCETKPFAFGMKCLEAGFVVEDEEGNNDKLEETLQGVPNVQGVEMLEMGRL
ncbi:MAG: elongation factor 1-beta [Thermoplasmatota archaeon]